jgi:glycerol-3-phosphate cytidylyltransferase
MIPPSDEPEVADEILRTLAGVCNDLGLIWFLYAGTALGFARDGAYLHKDNDLDVAILCGPNRTPAFLKAMEAEGFTIDKITPGIYGHFWKYNMLLDIRGINGEWGLGRATNECIMPYIQNGFDTIDYKGYAYNIPHPCEDYFTCCYGPNWGTPKPKNSTTVFAIVTCDILHIGHVRWLQKAAALGNYLLIGLRTDDFVTQDKGQPPVIPYEQRKEILESIRCIDFVEPFSAPDDLTALKKHAAAICAIDNLFPEYSWEVETRAALEAKGLRFVIIERTPDVSTTQIKKDCCHSLCHSGNCGYCSGWLHCFGEHTS